MRTLTERDPVVMNDGSLKQLNEVGGGGESYTLPAATANTLGGVKIGEGVTVAEDGTISVPGGGGGGFTPFEWTPLLAKIQIVENNSIRIGDVLIVAVSLYLSGTIDSNSNMIKNETITSADISSRQVTIPATSGPADDGTVSQRIMVSRLNSDQSAIVIAPKDTITTPYLTICGVLSLKDRYI